MEACQIKTLIEQVIGQHLPIEVAVDRLFQEMSRGSIILVIDENLYDLETELRHLNYTTRAVEPKMADRDIKRTLRSRIFITQNGVDFCNEMDLQSYNYGLIWLASGRDAKVMAKKVEAVLMTSRFKAKFNQCIKV